MYRDSSPEAQNDLQGGKSRNPVFILIAHQGDTTTLSAKGAVKPKNPPAKGRSILRTFYHNPARRPVFIIDCLKCGMYRDSSPGVRMTVAGGKSRNPVFILIAEGDTTTLSRKAAIKL